MSDLTLQTAVQYVRGVGPHRAELLDRLGLRTVEDLLFFLPRDVLDLTRVTSSLKSILIEGLPQIEAEVIYAARYEMAVTIEDFFARRTRIKLLSRDGGRAAASRVAQLLGRELGWKETETQRKLAEFLQQSSG